MRLSLPTFFRSNKVHPSVIQMMLRHAKPQTTARYLHSLNSKQTESQGKYLEAIKLRNDGKEAAWNGSRAGVRVGSAELTAGTNLFS
jgi:hypothetical protein